MVTTLEHLERCAVCLRRTLHRRVLQRDADGVVVSNTDSCVVCALRAAGRAPVTGPVLAMKEALSLKKQLRSRTSGKRARRGR